MKIEIIKEKRNFLPLQHLILSFWVSF